MTSGSEKQSVVSFGKESSFQMIKWALLKLLCTVDRGCAKLLRYAPLLTPLLSQSGVIKAREHSGKKKPTAFFLTDIVIFYIFYLSIVLRQLFVCL